MRVLVIILVSLGFLVVAPWVTYRYRRSPARRDKVVTAMLSAVQLGVDQETRAHLDRDVARRIRWGALGEEIGLVLSVPVVFAMLYAKLGLPTFVVIFMLTGLGAAIGHSMSGLSTTALAEGAPRFASVRPHSATDYLNHREIVVELACGAVGVAALLVSAIALIVGTQDSTTWLAAFVVGVAVTAGALTAVALQRRLLNAPVRASNASQLVAQDVVLAVGMRDLFDAVVKTTAFGVYGFLIWTSDSLAPPLLFLAAYLTIIHWFFGEDLPPSRLSVARQLAWENRA